MIKSEETEVNLHPRSLAPARPLHPRFCETDEPEKRCHWVRGNTPVSVLHYGIGGLGTGATPQMADAHGGRGGVGIRDPFPCLDAEQFGSVGGLPVMRPPLQVFLTAATRHHPSDISLR